MNVTVIVLVCIGCVYAIYSLVNLFIKVKKAGKENCVFKASASQWIIHGSGILLLASATFIFYEKGVMAWLLFFVLLCNVVIDFVARNTRISK